jgi:hypothetical protein
VKFGISLRGDHVLASLSGRETADEMREFLLAVHAACREHHCPKILMSIRRSRPVFKPEDYGLSSYANDLVTSACQVALVGDNAELHAAHEYIEVCARQQEMNVRAFRDEADALRWLRGAPEPGRRYRLTRIVVQGAPEDAGVYALWNGNEVVYYGRAGSIRARLLEHADKPSATHYSWEVAADPAAREAELLAEHERVYGRRPRDNAS